MTADNMDDFRALDPFFRVVEEGLAGLVDGGHFFDLLGDDSTVTLEYASEGRVGGDRSAVRQPVHLGGHDRGSKDRRLARLPRPAARPGGARGNCLTRRFACSLPVTLTYLSVLTTSFFFLSVLTIQIGQNGHESGQNR
jgi:hypothetical protein